MRRGILFILAFLFSLPLWATHQRAAEITYTWLGANSYEFTLTCYTYTPSAAGLQRDSLLMDWGDGFQDYVPRVVRQNLGNDYTLNIYKMRHDYSSAGTYVVSMEDANRNYGVVNMQNSVTIPMYIETELVINPFLGYNNSVQLLNAPVDRGCVGKLYLHNPAAYDPDGDSLSYRLLPCKGFNGEDIPSFTYPQASSSFEMDPVTGELHWDSPVIQGEYNVAFIVEEWRGGVKIGSVIRDMQILVAACDNDLPVIECPDEFCVEAGEQLVFTASAYDPDMTSVELTASGTPFELSVSPAYMSPVVASGMNPSSDFVWNTDGAHVRKMPYQVVFHAKDDGHPVSLTNVKTVSVSVIGPKVRNLVAEPVGDEVRLAWSSYPCRQARALRIYRKMGCDAYEPDNCETGAPDGFQMVAELDGVAADSYVDSGLAQGIQYSYRVLAVFRDGSESVASDVVCVSLKNESPLMTNVSNAETDLSSGNVSVKWAPPVDIPEGLLPPFRYRLKRSADGEESVVYEGSDTSYLDVSINLAVCRQLCYSVEMKDAFQHVVGESAKASSVWLEATGGDEKVRLRWSVSVPWVVDSTLVFRKESSGSVKIAAVQGFDYEDGALENGKEYTYFVCTYGHYMLTGLPRPLVNYSAVVKVVPNDNEPPSAPLLEVETDCDAVSNLLRWHQVPEDDLAGFRIYHTVSLSHGFSLVTQVDNPLAESYLHELQFSTVGCYYMTSFDVRGNVSLPSDTICVGYDVCPVYELPNVFTPNGDGINDVFVPTHAQLSLITQVKMVIFNRWGNVLLETTEPMINWDGKNNRTGLPCSEGVYFYVCDVEFQGVEGLEKMHFQGSIDVRR